MGNEQINKNVKTGRVEAKAIETCANTIKKRRDKKKEREKKKVSQKCENNKEGKLKENNFLFEWQANAFLKKKKKNRH